MLRGHAAAYRAIHEIQPEARVGYAHHHRPMVANMHGLRWMLMRKIHYDGLNMAFPRDQHRRDEVTRCEEFPSPKPKARRIFWD